MVTEIKYQKELNKLLGEHDFLETEISSLMRCKVIDQFRLLDLKKKKLRIKEMIASLQYMLYQDLTA